MAAGDDEKYLPRFEEEAQRASKAAQAAWHMLNLAGALASPRVLERIGQPPSRDELLERLDDFSEVMAGASGDDNEGARAAVMRLRTACADWIPGSEAPPNVRQGARSLLAAFGIPEPPEGWDAFEGPSPEPARKPEDPDPRPLPTLGELEARPDIFRVALAIEWCRCMASRKMTAKIAPALLQRPALDHIGTLIASFGPVRIHDAGRRAPFLTLLYDLEEMRRLAEGWSGAASPVPELQERARSVLVFLKVATSAEACEAFEDDIPGAYVEPPRK